jgi:lysophospholipase L1-like esterase
VTTRRCDIASWWRITLPLLGVVLAAGCTNPAAPTPPLFGPPTIACPAPQRFPSADGGALTVAYVKPQVSGGTDLVRTTCTPASGSSFPVGTTGVTCTAVDAEQRTASCSFDVSVVVPRISATKFVAFGDSITWGSNGRCVRSFTGDPLTWAFQDIQSLWLNAVPPAAAYPGVLQSLLAGRYVLQSFTVANEGVPGEAATAAATQTRLAAALDLHAPEVLLLQEGANDVNGRRTPASIAAALGSMVRQARGRGLPVFLGTLVPQRDGSCRAFQPDRIVPANVQIRAVAASEGAVLVDLYEAFLGQEGSLLDQDGLHPSVAGYVKIAETFFDAIRARLETP